MKLVTSKMFTWCQTQCTANQNFMMNYFSSILLCYTVSLSQRCALFPEPLLPNCCQCSGLDVNTLWLVFVAMFNLNFGHFYFVKEQFCCHEWEILRNCLHDIDVLKKFSYVYVKITNWILIWVTACHCPSDKPVENHGSRAGYSIFVEFNSPEDHAGSSNSET